LNTAKPLFLGYEVAAHRYEAEEEKWEEKGEEAE